jgi:hypothetical protein
MKYQALSGVFVVLGAGLAAPELSASWVDFCTAACVSLVGGVDAHEVS